MPCLPSGITKEGFLNEITMCILVLAALLLCLPVWAMAVELDITGMSGEIAITTDGVTLTGASDKVWVVVTENVSSLTLKNCTIGANDEEQDAITFETSSSAVSKGF